MRTGFARDVDPARTRFGDDRHAASATHVDDVQPATGFPGEIDRGADRLEFGRDRSRVEKIADTFLAGGARGSGQRARHLFRLRVNRDKKVQLCGASHSGAQCFLIHEWEIANAAVAHERLQTNDAAIAQRFKIVEISRDKSAPQSEIHERTGLGCGAFQFETLAIRRGRTRVQRHLEHGGGSARGRRPRTSGEAFPIRPARFIEMNVRVDDPGKNSQIARIDFRFRRAGQVFREGNDLSFADSDVLLATAHEQIEITHEWRAFPRRAIG